MKKSFLIYFMVWYEIGRCEDCPPPNLPSHSHLVTKESTIYKDKTFLYYQCDDGYSFNEKEDQHDKEVQHKIQCTNGSWEPKIIKCVDACQNKCGQHGHCETTLTGIGDVTSICICDINFAGPSCTARVCEAPLVLPHGIIHLTEGSNVSNKFMISSTIQYDCVSGYKITKGNTKSRCDHDGWTLKYVPICEEIKCENTHISDSSLRYVPMKQSYTAGSVVSFFCENLNVANPASSKCLEDGSWSQIWPSCQRKRCGTPSQINNGFFKVIGSLVKYSCDQNYVLSGNDQLDCQEGNWIGIVPVCITWFSFCQAQNLVAVLERNTYKCWNKKDALAKQDSTTQPLAVVTGTAGGLLLLLLLLIVIVACQRRRIARRIDHQRFINEDDDRCSFVYYSNDVHVVLPSYDEAIQARRPQPPPYNENSPSQNEVSVENPYESIEEVSQTAVGLFERSVSSSDAAYAEVQRNGPSSSGIPITNGPNGPISNENVENTELIDDDEKQHLIPGDH